MKLWFRSDAFGVYGFTTREEALKPKSCGNRNTNEFGDTEGAVLETKYFDLGLSEAESEKAWKEPILKILISRNPSKRQEV